MNVVSWLGVELLAIVDKKGKSAMDYAVTDEMRRCLLLENLSKQKETMQRKPGNGFLVCTDPDGGDIRILDSAAVDFFLDFFRMC